jgi:hypothetical protein
MADPDTELEKLKLGLEKQKFEFEKAKWEDDRHSREREFNLKMREVEANVSAQNLSRIVIPIAAAILAALLTGAASVVVAWKTADWQSYLEDTKEADTHKLEQERAEATRKLEQEKAQATRVTGAIKDDADKTADNLKLLVDLGLISDKNVSDKITEYRKNRPGGAGAGEVASPPATEPKNPPQPESQVKTQDTVLFQSGWVGGGHNQNEMCQQGIQALKGQFPGKTLSVVSSDEQSRKDFLGHVEYNYSCVFHVG